MLIKALLIIGGLVLYVLFVWFMAKFCSINNRYGTMK